MYRLKGWRKDLICGDGVPPVGMEITDPTMHLYPFTIE